MRKEFFQQSATAIKRKKEEQKTTLNELFNSIRDELQARIPELKVPDPVYRDFRAGDVRHSRADITKIKNLLGYQPEFKIGQGLKLSMDWYIEDLL